MAELPASRVCCAVLLLYDKHAVTHPIKGELQKERSKNGKISTEHPPVAQILTWVANGNTCKVPFQNKDNR